MQLQHCTCKNAMCPMDKVFFCPPFDCRSVNIVYDLLPAILLNALRQNRFDGSPLWRIAYGTNHVKFEVTFRKSTNQHLDKKRPKSRRRPTPPPHPPTPPRPSPTTDDFYYKTDNSSPTINALSGEGDDTNTFADRSGHYKTTHQAGPHRWSTEWNGDQYYEYDNR